jgi:hypothetical protein
MRKRESYAIGSIIQKLVVTLCFITGISISVLTGAAFPVDEWKSEDIGITEAGSTDIKGDVITITANGADIWDAADGCRYVYREVTGDFEISAHFVSLERANEWSKAGLMVRQSLDANSQHTFLNVTPDHGAKMIHRDTPGANTGPEPWEKNFECPIWLKLVRKGNEFSSFLSKDGKNWEAADVPGTPSIAAIDMTDPVLVGIAVTSHVSGTLTTAVVQKIQGSGGLSLSVEPRGSSIVTWAHVRRRGV